MDQQMDIYVNVERPSPAHSNTSKEKKSSKHIYENVIIGTRKAGPVLPEADGVKRSSCRAAAVFLGLLCLLLLAGLITMIILYIKCNSERSMAMTWTTINNNLTRQRQELRQ
ncbi:hypothetical protein INR49_015439 [Caranx melampygus]|nr:hypothetical protein INR49_015439 [Caranx melampygus]